MEVRAYEASDESRVVGLWAECGLTRPWNDPRRDIARKCGVQPELFLVGTEDGEIVATAMAGYEGHRGWVNYLAVAPAHRGRGHALALMNRIEALLLEAGCPKLNLQVRADNEEAIEFYRRIGYAQDDVVSYGKRLVVDLPPA